MSFSAEGGGVRVVLSEGETETLSDLAGQLVAMLGDRSAEAGDSGDPLLVELGIGGGATVPVDPAVARLLPDAYRGDDAASSEHRRLTERGLIDRKVANASAVVASLKNDTVVLDSAQVQCWLRTLTDLRLTIAARLDIVDDGDAGRMETDSDFALQAAYDWLGYLQGNLVDAIDD